MGGYVLCVCKIAAATTLFPSIVSYLLLFSDFEDGRTSIWRLSYLDDASNPAYNSNSSISHFHSHYQFSGSHLLCLFSFLNVRACTQHMPPPGANISSSPVHIHTPKPPSPHTSAAPSVPMAQAQPLHMPHHASPSTAAAPALVNHHPSGTSIR